MAEPHIGSRYELVDNAPSGPGSDYYAIRPSDTEESRAGDELIGYVHSWEVGTTVDGPGIRFVGFLTGCFLRCQFCHNPDTWHKANGYPVTVSRAMEQIGKYARVLKISRGGITLSGGEPVVQRAFAMEILRRCKQELGLHTCIETAGALGHRLTDEDLGFIDLNILDIKGGDPASFERVANHPMQPTLEYARRLSDLGRPMWVRFVLVPGLTDAWDNVQKLADLCAGLKSLERVEILPFHQMGRDKWARLGLEYKLENTEPPDAELSERVRGQFRSHGLTVY